MKATLQIDIPDTWPDLVLQNIGVISNWASVVATNQGEKMVLLRESSEEETISADLVRDFHESDCYIIQGFDNHTWPGMTLLFREYQLGKKIPKPYFVLNKELANRAFLEGIKRHGEYVNLGINSILLYGSWEKKLAFQKLNILIQMAVFGKVKYYNQEW